MLIALISQVATLAVSAGSGAVVGNAIKAGTPAAANLLQKSLIGIGGFVLADMVSEAAVKHVQTKIKDATEKIKNIVHPEEDEPETDPQD